MWKHFWSTLRTFSFLGQPRMKIKKESATSRVAGARIPHLNMGMNPRDLPMCHLKSELEWQRHPAPVTLNALKGYLGPPSIATLLTASLFQYVGFCNPAILPPAVEPRSAVRCRSMPVLRPSFSPFFFFPSSFSFPTGGGGVAEPDTAFPCRRLFQYSGFGNRTAFELPDPGSAAEPANPLQAFLRIADFKICLSNTFLPGCRTYWLVRQPHPTVVSNRLLSFFFFWISQMKMNWLNLNV